MAAKTFPLKSVFFLKEMALHSSDQIGAICSRGSRIHDDALIIDLETQWLAQRNKCWAHVPIGHLLHRDGLYMEPRVAHFIPGRRRSKRPFDIFGGHVHPQPLVLHILYPSNE